MSKEEDIKRKYEGELMKSQQDIEHLKAQATQILQERNELIQERAQLIRQCQEEYERAEKYEINFCVARTPPLFYQPLITPTLFFIPSCFLLTSLQSAPCPVCCLAHTAHTIPLPLNAPAPFLELGVRD